MEDVSTKRLYSQDNDIPLQIFVWLLEILFQSTKQMLYEWTLKCAVSLDNHLKAVTEAFHPLRTHQHYWTSERWTSQKWSKGRNASVTVWDGSLVTLHPFVLLHITSVVKLIHIFVARRKTSKSYLRAIFGFHYK